MRPTLALTIVCATVAVLFVTPDVALTIRATFDLGIGGSRWIGGASVDSQTNDFGVNAGLLVVF